MGPLSDEVGNIEGRMRKSLDLKLNSFIKKQNPKQPPRRALNIYPRQLNLNLASQRIGNVNQKEYFKIEPQTSKEKESMKTPATGIE